MRNLNKAAAPVYLQPRTGSGIWFHYLSFLSTIRRAIVAIDASTTLASMTMAVAY